VTTDSWTTATAVLRLAAQLVEGIQHGVAERGFDDVRPMHGFAFEFLSTGPVTAAQLAAHLGVTKQATSELVQYLIDRGYVTRTPDPVDRRARLLELTDRGRECTRAAQDAAQRTVKTWELRLSPGQAAALRDGIAAAVLPGPLRPSW
jgi:DNA-binding MarR family transcriptional regulator